MRAFKHLPSIGKELRKLRVDFELTQAELGKLFPEPVSCGDVSRWERGIRPIYPNQLRQLGVALKLPNERVEQLYSALRGEE